MTNNSNDIHLVDRRCEITGTTIDHQANIKCARAVDQIWHKISNTKSILPLIENCGLINIDIYAVNYNFLVINKGKCKLKY